MFLAQIGHKLFFLLMLMRFAHCCFQYFVSQVTWKYKLSGEEINDENKPENFKFSDDRLTLTIDVSLTLN